jgi:hypothetical protein
MFVILDQSSTGREAAVQYFTPFCVRERDSWEVDLVKVWSLGIMMDGMGLDGMGMGWDGLWAAGREWKMVSELFQSTPMFGEAELS